MTNIPVKTPQSEAERQVKEIIQLLAPNQPNQTDAVHLVQQLVQKTDQTLMKTQKQNQVLEAEVQELKKKVHLLVNEKLKLINGEPREVTETNEVVEAPARQAGVPKGPTL